MAAAKGFLPSSDSTGGGGGGDAEEEGVAVVSGGGDIVGMSPDQIGLQEEQLTVHESGQKLGQTCTRL